MDDLNDLELEKLFSHLKRRVECSESLVASNEDIAGTHESLDGLWGEWMCQECGAFMKEHRRRCQRCDTPRM